MATNGQKLKVVVAGWKWGANHLRAFAESDVCELGGVWSRTDNDGAKRVANLFHVPLYTDFGRMLDEVKPDVASVATPERAHDIMTLGVIDECRKMGIGSMLLEKTFLACS